ncbi:hypothetical protein [Leifsonia aquatica]|uniref:hypothetical protein n=1 Tax=Leifsonia aquatica TaxID=144185 RepID=UPI001F0671B2|nr:hypothetical protein [Leifsonia aquatica]
MDLNPSDEQTVRVQRALWRHWGTPAAIYGTIVYASVVAAATVDDKDPAAAVRVLVFSVVSIVVFWLAHVYSTALGFHGDADRMSDRMRDSLRHALGESAGMLEAAVIPSVPLVLAVLGFFPVEFATFLALWLAVLMLALLGFLVFLVRHRPIGICLLGAVVTGLFGVIVIVLKIALQH